VRQYRSAGRLIGLAGLDLSSASLGEWTDATGRPGASFPETGIEAPRRRSVRLSRIG
jgi:hypothetical protein